MVEPPVSNSGPCSTTTMSPPAASAQVVRDPAADDARADDDKPCLVLHIYTCRVVVRGSIPIPTTGPHPRSILERRPRAIAFCAYFDHGFPFRLLREAGPAHYLMSLMLL